ncbi:ribonuclease HIII [Bacillus massiliigorillae]|uniref:ribonuclease HIII n=1 Tax=Bacillus massiliigorillae TaxID=1243664 RepID=UPI00039BCDAB|nr:ribonuclease HIII [Bacillus massiliigorillae]
MANVVLQMTLSSISELKAHYQAKISPTVPPGGVFAAKVDRCNITAYKSGKVLFQGANAEKEAGLWSSKASTPKPTTATKKSSVKNHAYTPPSNIGEMSIIGSDEVGTGDYFGPITVAAVYADKASIPLLKELGVRDSKNIKDPEILQIASQLKHAVPFSLLVLDNVKYNTLQAKGMSQGKIKAYLHNLALKKLIEKIKPTEAEAVLVDQFAKPDVFFGYLKDQEQFQAKKIYLSTGAESVHVSVAAASILARAAFVKKFEALSKEAGFTIPKGAGPHVDVAAARLIKEKGMESLQSFTKMHFANTDKAKKLLKK